MTQDGTRPQAARPRAGGGHTDRPLHLAFLLYAGSGGGIERVVPPVAAGLAKRGHQVDVVCLYAKRPPADAGSPEFAAADGFRVWELRGGKPAAGPARPAGEGGYPWIRGRVRARLQTLRNLAAHAAGRMVGALGIAMPHPALFEWIERRRPDAVFGSHELMNALLLATCPVTDAAGVPVIHGWMPRKENLRVGARRHFLYGTVVPRWRAAPVVVSVSRALGRRGAAETGLAESRVRVVPNPFDFDRIAELAKKTPPDWPDDGLPVLVTAGRLDYLKDKGTLVRAAGELAARRRPVRLLVLGEGPEREALRRAAQAAGVGNLVAFPGWVDNPFPYMRRADAFVLSSRFEGRPNVIIEALACGCPVVTTAWDGAEEVGAPGSPLARIVPMGDPSALADAIAATLEEGRGDEDARIAAVRAQHDPEAILDAYEGAAREAAAAPVRRPAPAAMLRALARRSAARKPSFRERHGLPKAR